MNHVVSQSRLFRGLVLRPRILLGLLPIIIFTMLATIVATGLTFWAQVALIVIVVLRMRPHWPDYQALSLNTAMWKRHRRWLGALAVGVALLVALLLRVLTPAGDYPPLIYPALVGVALLPLVDSPDRERLRGRRATQVDGRLFPVDPVTQIIRRPQLTWWATIWLAAAVYTLVRWAVDVYMGAENSLFSGMIFLIVLLPFVVFSQRPLRSSLRQWIAFGGTRGRWARETWIISGINLVVAVLVGAFLLAYGAGLGDVAVVLGFLMLFTVGTIFLDLLDAAASPVLAVPLVAAVAVLAGYAWGAPSAVVAAGAVAVFAVLGVSLPRAVERVSVFTAAPKGA
ncbi:hypothetical protein [Corynebacterium sp.]|uniref:hypothetical protein n=1 Tax=Corynebacterium sp. TaxID=1720 RepID=UPI0026DEA8F9|nr:hypothetical protein [Corynebacterium sp.]MDO5512203.1 hypothetical protein [Corynebacterium sp.]